MNSRINSVLLIDDDEPTNIFTSIIFEEIGYTNHIRVAHSGKEALDYLTNCMQNDTAHCPPDLIFLDINMPAMDGWEFLDEFQKIRKKKDRNPVIVMLTTSLNPDDKAKATRRSDVSLFEVKPLTEEKLNNIFRLFFPGIVESKAMEK